MQLFRAVAIVTSSNSSAAPELEGLLDNRIHHGQYQTHDADGSALVEYLQQTMKLPRTQPRSSEPPFVHHPSSSGLSSTEMTLQRLKTTPSTTVPCTPHEADATSRARPRRRRTSCLGYYEQSCACLSASQRLHRHSKNHPSLSSLLRCRQVIPSTCP